MKQKFMAHKMNRNTKNEIFYVGFYVNRRVKTIIKALLKQYLM